MTEPKCDSFYCQRKHQCGRYENTPEATFKTHHKYDRSRPWLCFVPKIADDCEDELDMYKFENLDHAATIQMDIMEFDLNELVRTI